MYRTNRNWAVIKLILQLRAYEADYPKKLLRTRRHYYLMLLERFYDWYSS